MTVSYVDAAVIRVSSSDGAWWDFPVDPSSGTRTWSWRCVAGGTYSVQATGLQAQSAPGNTVQWSAAQQFDVVTYTLPPLPPLTIAELGLDQVELAVPALEPSMGALSRDSLRVAQRFKEVAWPAWPVLMAPPRLLVAGQAPRIPVPRVLAPLLAKFVSGQIFWVRKGQNR